MVIFMVSYCFRCAYFIAHISKFKDIKIINILTSVTQCGIVSFNIFKKFFEVLLVIMFNVIYFTYTKFR